MPSLKPSSPCGAAGVVSIRKGAAEAMVAVPELTAAALELLKSGVFHGSMCAEAAASNIPLLSLPPSKWSHISPTRRGPVSCFLSADALVTVGPAADVKVSEFEFDSISTARRLSLSLITDTDIADECQSLTSSVDGRVSISLPYTLSRSTCSFQHKSRDFFAVRSCKCGASCATPTSIGAAAARTEATANSDVVTAMSNTTNMSPGHSISSSRSFLRSPRARVWRTAVPQSNRHVGASVPGLLEETG
ncbi:hypothetical protein CGC21_25675 [Leishmania donovani]|uniref:Uncharacterized protein n=1 Tax=Leishmania donovani TaxID=5661 RepID=A0A504WTQ7_LEIDO|nr:hypothetical protein CGC21_25675 [Leishmania donovani]